MYWYFREFKQLLLQSLTLEHPTLTLAIFFILFLFTKCCAKLCTNNCSREKMKLRGTRQGMKDIFSRDLQHDGEREVRRQNCLQVVGTAES